jgi:hypothetical protein
LFDRNFLLVRPTAAAAAEMLDAGASIHDNIATLRASSLLLKIKANLGALTHAEVVCHHRFMSAIFPGQD